MNFILWFLLLTFIHGFKTTFAQDMLLFFFFIFTCIVEIIFWMYVATKNADKIIKFVENWEPKN